MIAIAAQGCNGRYTAARRQRGLGAVAAVMVLVMLSALAAAVVRLGWTHQVAIAQDIDSARATQAAGAGIQWGLYQVLRGGWAACAGAPQTLDLRSETGFRVTVNCTVNTYNEGESSEGVAQQVRIYTLDATACNGSTSSCPDNSMVSSPAYVERRRTSQVTN